MSYRTASDLIVMLGHGRALEVYLIGVKLLFAVSIAIPGKNIQVIALNDLFWLSDYWLSLPFFIVGFLQLIGIALNVMGVESSWIWRTSGASLAVTIWAWLIFKSIFIGAIGTGAFPFWVMSFFASVFLLWKGMNRLPIPGVPGAI